MPFWVGTTKVYRYCVLLAVLCAWGLDGFSVNGFISWRLDSKSTGQPRCRSCFSCKGTRICLATSSFYLASLNGQGWLLFRCSLSGIIIISCMKMRPSPTDSSCLMWMSLWYLLFYCVKLVTSTPGMILSYCVKLVIFVPATKITAKLTFHISLLFFFSFVTRSQLKEPTAERNINRTSTHLELHDSNILYLNTIGFRAPSL